MKAFQKKSKSFSVSIASMALTLAVSLSACNEDGTPQETLNSVKEAVQANNLVRLQSLLAPPARRTYGTTEGLQALQNRFADIQDFKLGTLEQLSVEKASPDELKCPPGRMSCPGLTKKTYTLEVLGNKLNEDYNRLTVAHISCVTREKMVSDLDSTSDPMEPFANASSRVSSYQTHCKVTAFEAI